LKKSISAPFTTTFPPDSPNVKLLPKKVIGALPTYQTPVSSDGTGPPLGQSDGVADALGNGLGEAVGLGCAAAGVGLEQAPRTNIAKSALTARLPCIE